MAEQFVQKDWNTPKNNGSLGLLTVLMQPFVGFNTAVIQLQILTRYPDYVMPLKHKKRFLQRATYAGIGRR